MGKWKGFGWYSLPHVEVAVNKIVVSSFLAEFFMTALPIMSAWELKCERGHILHLSFFFIKYYFFIVAVNLLKYFMQFIDNADFKKAHDAV